jgi:susD family
MKLTKLYRAAAGLLALATVSACESALDMAPDGYVSIPQIFQDNEQTGAWLNTCYEYIPEMGIKFHYWSRGLVVWSDEAWDSDEGAGLMSGLLYKGQASADNHPIVNLSANFGNGDYWNRYWAAIRKCAVFLSYIDGANVTSQSDKMRWKAEAHVLRAYYYSELLRWYGTGLPIVREAYALDTDFGKVVKPSFYESVQFVIEDCNAALAISQLPWRITTAAEAGRMTKAVAEAIRARMILYAASPLYNDGQDHWDEAYRITKEAVTNLKKNGYALYDKVNYPEFKEATAFLPNDGAALYNEYFTSTMEYTADPADRETIYQNKADQGAVFQMDGIGINGDKSGTNPSQELVDCYETVDGEPVLDLANPYEDEMHLTPNYNPENRTYDPQNPYENRDPRFYASIYYNGSKRHCYWKVTEDPKCIENYPAEPGTRTRIIATYPEEPFTGLMGAGQGGQRTRTGYYERKFLHPYAAPTYPGSAGANFKMFRLGEAILNFAEAAAEAGHEDEAIAAVNEIRSRVGMPGLDAGLSGDELMLRIRNERRVELAMEGFRYYDVRRWSLPSGDLSETDRYLTAARVTRNGDGTYSYARQLVGERMCYQNKFLWLPIPLNEANLMTTLTGVNWQNPGW